MIDPIVEEVRRIRDEHARSLDYDLDAICDDYKKRQARLGERLVRLGPKTLASLASPPQVATERAS